MARSPSDFALQRAEWQKALFALIPHRLDLAQLKPTWPISAWRIRVHRNHAFEHVATASRAWLNFAKRAVEWSYSNYDDAFSFEGITRDDAFAAEVIWADVAAMQSNIAGAEVVQWLEGRVRALRALTVAPILVVVVGLSVGDGALLAAEVKATPGVRVGDVGSMLMALGDGAFELRTQKLSGTRLSDRAMLVIAREFACRWIPALVAPRLKAVAVDLDQTLYAGVLGEDGMQVQLTPGYLALQQKLVALHGEGIYLAMVSKNEPQDVEQLFAVRNDFPLQLHHFSGRAIGWQDKAQGLRLVAQTLRIGCDSILFIDDNPGELAAICANLPEINTLHVESGAEAAVRSLDYFPGLWTWGKSAVDAQRSADLRTECQRTELATQHESQETYLQSLKIELTITAAPVAHVRRVHELSQKTNQFNLNLARLSEAAVAEALQAGRGFVATVALRDRLSDSGIIGALVGHRGSDALEVTDLVVSCRALGRRLEDLIVFGALHAIRRSSDPGNVRFHYRRGPRNQPALDWLIRKASIDLADTGSVLMALPGEPLPLAQVIRMHLL
jgi:FkbH-like protein